MSANRLLPDEDVEFFGPRPATTPARPEIVAPRRPRRPPSCLARLLRVVVLLLLILIGLPVALDLLFPAGRTNILLIGLDRRPGETGPARADTLILTTVFPQDDYAGMLSIPRDLWVTLPDGSPNRINAAHFFAEADAPGSGPAATVQTVASNFGVTLNYYVRLDFAGFVRIVDAAGGIEVDVERPIVDYAYPTHDYGVMVVEFQPGRQHMDGERALQYARIRHGGSDFQRAERQQAVIAAFAARMASPAAWVRLPLVWAAVQSSVDTNLPPWQMARLAPTLLRLGPGGLDRRVIDQNMVTPYTTPAGASVVLPNWGRINPVLLEMFNE